MVTVEISLPKDLLAEVDAEAKRRGSTRSEVIQSFADHALRQRRETRASAITALLTDVSAHGGNTAEQLKRIRRIP